MTAIVITVGLAVVLAGAFAVLGTAKVAKTSSMLARAGHVGFSAQRYQLIGVAEVFGAIGVLLGLADRALGYAAGAGLVVLMAGALVTHARRGDGPAEMAPAALFAGAAVAYLILLGAAR